MAKAMRGLSPSALDESQHAVWNSLVNFWRVLHESGDYGVSTWETLEPLWYEVTDCLYRDPPDFDRAMSLTYKAELLIAGLDEL